MTFFKDRKIVVQVGIVLVLFLYIVGCSKINNTSALNYVNEIINENPSQALEFLNEVELPSQLEGAEKAEYWRLLGLVHYKTGGAMTEDSLILYSLDYYKTHEEIDNLLQTYVLSYKYYQWTKQDEKREQLFKEAIAFAEVNNKPEYLLELYRLEAHYNYSISNKKRSAELYKKALEYRKDADFYYMIGISNPGDSLKWYIEQAVNIALEKEDTLHACHYLRNYAQFLLEEKRYDEVRRVIYRTWELSDYYKTFGLNSILLSVVNLAENKIDSAQFYLDKAKEYKSGTSFGDVNELNLIGTENLLASIQLLINYIDTKEIDFLSSGRFNDSIISSVMEKNRILQAQQEANTRLEKVNLNLILYKKDREQKLIIISFLFVMGCVLGYVYYRNHKRKEEESEERIESLYRLLKDATSKNALSKEDTAFFKKALLQQLGIIRLVANSPTAQNQELLKRIVNISQEDIATEPLLAWDDLYPVIDSIYNNFYTRLMNAYGSLLIEKEIQLCCLICAEFTTKEISVVTQQTSPTIYQRKTNIRKKLEMDQKEDILTFLWTKI